MVACEMTSDVREKLVELIYNNSPRLVEEESEILAKRLIANGVTVQEYCHKAESVISKTGLLCTACHSDIDRDAVFCQYCGAKAIVGDDVTVQEWIPVSERLPIEEAIAFEEEWDDYPEFLVMIDGGYLPTTLYYDLEKNEWFRINTALNRETYRVTHWQCLPHPPKGE